MGQHQYTKLYRRVELDIEFVPIGSTGKVFWELATERPGSAGVADRHTGVLDFSASQVNLRQPRRINFHGAVRGRMFQLTLRPATKAMTGEGAIFLFGGRVYRKVLHPHQQTTWEWEPIPIPGTSDVWGEVTLPIPPTSLTWGTAGLPIPSTPDTWGERGLPIPPTPETWQQADWPFRRTPVEPVWLQLPVDA